jgi:hypothetical protein
MNNERSDDPTPQGEFSAEVTRRQFGALALAAGAMLVLPAIIGATVVDSTAAAQKPAKMPRVAARFPR